VAFAFAVNSKVPSSGNSTSPQGRRTSQHAVARNRTIAAAALVVVGAIVLASVLWQVTPSPGRSASPPGAGVGSNGAEVLPASGEYRLVYRHSVIPGGVRTPEETALAMRRDPVVAAHYKDI